MRLLAITCVFLFSSVVFAKDTYVKGYVRKDGKYVEPHFRSESDGKFENNYSTKGNTNPYTGKKGTKTYEYDSSTFGDSSSDD